MAKKGWLAVGQYARMWPREVFDCRDADRGKPLAKLLDILSKPGVYVLYRDDVPYYVGQASRLHHRLWLHANRPDGRYYNFWNFFSAFVVEDGKHRNLVEGILIAAMPTANSAKPMLKGEKFSKPVTAMLRTIRRHHANPPVNQSTK